MAAPQLFYLSPETIISEIEAWYEDHLDREILPAQPEMQILLSQAYRETLLRSLGDYVLSQVLVDTAVAPMLDYKARNEGLTRLAPTPAVTTLGFTLLPGHGGVIIPVGTKVATTDGKIEFATDVEVPVPAGVNYAEAEATALTDGASGNDYGIGLVSVIITPQAFLISATNTTVTAAGAAQESDEGLRARIILAKSQYAAAGPNSAYKFHARSASPLIIDVEVTNPSGRHVNIYPLVSGGVVTPQAILDAVYAVCNAEDKRPLTDIVTVISPTKISYTLTFNVILKYGVIQSTTIQAIQAGLAAYCIAQSKKLGAGITDSQLIDAAMNPNVYDISFPGFSDISVPPTSFAVCTSFTIGTVTYENPNV